jgi:predicted metal-binding protein
MNIVKEFESNEYAISRSQSTSFNPCLSYGLGDDGHLYCKCRMSGYMYDTWCKPSFYISISEMKKIVKEFGDLLIFI